MKKLQLATILATAVFTSGCVQTVYSKSVAVTKDETGRVIQTVETESVSQPGQGWPLKLKTIRDVQP